MFDFITYLGQSALCLVALYIIYKAAMSHETLHRLNRVTLLMMVVLSAVLPMCRIEIVREVDAVLTPIVDEESVVAVATNAAPETVDYRPIMEDALVVIFLIGAAFMVVRLAMSWLSVWRVVRSGEHEELGEGVRLTVVEKLSSPFSWFRHVVVSRTDMGENRDLILEHELAHVRFGHSWDVLFVDLTLIVWWFNPAMWLLRRELQSLHEYQADDAVLNRGIDAKTYQLLLIKRAVGSRLHSVANCLNHSNLKNRITMMCRKQSSKWQSAKLLLVLPMVAISLSAFATTVYVTRESHDKDNENSYNNKNWKKAVIEIAGSKILLNDKQVTPEELDACIEEYILQTLIYNANDAESVKTYESIYNTLKKNRAIDQIYPNGERPTSTIHLNGDKIYLNGELISLEDIKKRVEEINSHTISITANADANEKHIAELKEAIHHTGNVLKLNSTQDSDDPTKAKFYAEQVEKIEEQMKFFDQMKSEYEAVMKEFEALKDEFEKNDEKAYVEMQKQFTEMQKQFTEFENHYGELDSVIAKRMALIKEYSKNGHANIRLEGGKIYLDGKLTSAEKLEKYFAENKKLINIKVADDKSGEALAKVKELARQNQILTINYEQVRFLPAEESINQANESASRAAEAVPNSQSSESQQKDLAYVKVQKMPTFQGGELNKFINWFQANVKYPKDALDAKVEGRVIFSFVVEKDGSLSEFNVLQTPDKSLAEEAERVFKASPKDWTAGEQNGNKVRVKLTVPLIFKMPNAVMMQKVALFSR